MVTLVDFKISGSCERVVTIFVGYYFSSGHSVYDLSFNRDAV